MKTDRRGFLKLIVQGIAVSAAVKVTADVSPDNSLQSVKTTRLVGRAAGSDDFVPISAGNSSLALGTDGISYATTAAFAMEPADSGGPDWYYLKQPKDNTE